MTSPSDLMLLAISSLLKCCLYSWNPCQLSCDFSFSPCFFSASLVDPSASCLSSWLPFWPFLLFLCTPPGLISNIRVTLLLSVALAHTPLLTSMPAFPSSLFGMIFRPSVSDCQNWIWHFSYPHPLNLHNFCIPPCEGEVYGAHNSGKFFELNQETPKVENSPLFSSYFSKPIHASLMAQAVKNLPALRETRVWSLGWEDPLEEGMATHSSILAWRIPMDRGAWRATVHGVTKSRTQLND